MAQKATLEGLTRKSRRIVNNISATNPVVVDGQISTSVCDSDREQFETMIAKMNLEIVEVRSVGKSARGWQDRLTLEVKNTTT
jgi:hypothetical protein